MKNLKYFLPIIAGIFIMAGIVWAANLFPTTLNNWQNGDVIEEGWANALEAKIGVDNSAVQTSLDYLIKNSTSSLYRIAKTDGGFVVGDNTNFVLETGATARTSMGLGTMATESAANYLSLSTWFSTTSHALISSLPSLSITESQISNLGNYLTYSAATSTYLQMSFASSTYPSFTYATSTYFIQRNATTTLDYWLTKQTTTGLAEGNNLYWTTARDMKSNWQFIGINALKPTSSIGIIVSASSTFAASLDFASGTTTGQFIYPAFTYSTTSWEGATTTIALGVAYIGETWLGVKCFTDTGTVSLRFGDGTNKMDWVAVNATVGEINLSTNNTFTAGEKRYVDIGNPVSSPTIVSCSIKKKY